MNAFLNETIAQANASLRDEQKTDGHFVYELEADATIPAEYVLLEHYLDRIEPELEAKIGVYLRRIQGDSPHNPGGWPLFHDGKLDISASVKAYFALKALGDDPSAPHMLRAKNAILAAGGAERSNVFTRIQLALFGAVPWRACPVVPIELMLMPSWFPINMRKISYWSRTVLTPLMVLTAKKPLARNPKNIRIDELFNKPPEQITDWIRGPFRSPWGYFFKQLDVLIRFAEPYFPKKYRERAIAAAIEFIKERLNGEDGLGAIYPAMANTVMMYDLLGYPPDHPDFAIAWASVRKLLVVKDDYAYCQPCLSPIWDTALAGHALAESGSDRGVAEACDWLTSRQILDVVGDWADNAQPNTPPGGWAFQYNNPHYPDVDDTAVVAMLLHRSKDPAYATAIERARLWILGMQSSNGAWGAFDVNNDRQYLNHIPFADHGALLDPPTEDVTARCISFLAQLDLEADKPAIARGIAYLRKIQMPDGSWFGRWGTNYIYGTWSVLCALNAAGVPHDDLMIRRAANWLIHKQREDGGWGEDCESYGNAPAGEFTESLPSQSAWAMLGLMAAGCADQDAVKRGAAYLQSVQQEDGSWTEKPYNAVGFPRVFYLRYHGYPRFFPLMALSRYKNLLASNDRQVKYGF